MCENLNHGGDEEVPVVSRKELTLADLRDLFVGKITVLRIQNYIPRVTCDRLHAFLMERATEIYTHDVNKDSDFEFVQDTGVYRFGLPLNSTFGDATGAALESYLRASLPCMRALRQASLPYLSPADKLRAELDETWEGRVGVARIDGRKAFCGIGRLMLNSERGLFDGKPHVDSVPTRYFPRIRKQFSANIYLRTPENGGELEVYPHGDRSPPVTAKPATGDMLLFSTRSLHGVAAFEGPRSSIQVFIGLTEEDDIFLWN